MKRVIITSIVLCLGCCVCTPGLHALDGVFFGMGAEANANTRDEAAGAGSFTLGIDANRHIAFGLKTVYSNNFNTVSSLESIAFLRWYVPLQSHGLFIQMELGNSAIFEDNKGFRAPLSSLGAGWRIVFGNYFYIEPFVRGGYPFIWGAGITTGLRFSSQTTNSGEQE